MKHRRFMSVVRVLLTAAAVCLLIVACDEAGAGGDSGTLQVTVTGGDTTDDVMFFGVVPAGTEVSDSTVVAFCEDQTFAVDGSTTSTGSVIAISDEDTDPDTIWYGTGGTTYDVYVFVDLGANGGSNNGPNTGDKIYSTQYTQDGNATISAVYPGDFEDFTE